MAPNPARMQSCRAMMVAVARCCGSMQVRDVASLVALSSSSACSRMEEILRLCQSMCLSKSLTQVIQGCANLLYQHFQLSHSLPQSFHDFRRGLAEKLLVCELR